MGCWNGTCFISHLPIFPGDKVALIPIMQNPYEYKEFGGGGVCYSTHYARPMTIPIFGEYNDYGGLEKIEEKSMIVFEHFKNLFAEKRLCFQQTSRAEYYTKDALTSFEGLIDAIQSGNVATENDFEKGLKIGFVMCHVSIYDALVNENGSRMPWKHTFTMRTFYDRVIQMIALSKTALNVESKDIKEFSRFSFIDFPIPHELYTFKDWPLNYYVKQYDESTEDVLRFQMLDFILFNDAVQSLRINYIPQAGAGSQCCEMLLHRVVAENVQLMCKKRISDCNDWNEPEEDQADDDLLKETHHVMPDMVEKYRLNEVK